jgi:hypothetical protein
MLLWGSVDWGILLQMGVGFAVKVISFFFFLVKTLQKRGKQLVTWLEKYA